MMLTNSPLTNDLGLMPAMVSIFMRSSISVSTKVIEDLPANCMLSLTCSQPPASNCHSARPGMGVVSGFRPRTILYQRTPVSMSRTAAKARTFLSMDAAKATTRGSIRIVQSEEDLNERRLGTDQVGTKRFLIDE